MTYQQFINTALNIVNKLINVVKIVYNYLINNYFFKTIIYFILISFVITMLFKIYDIVLYVFSKRKTKETKTERIE